MDDWPAYSASGAVLSQPGQLAPSGDMHLQPQWQLAQPHMANIDTSVVYDNFFQNPANHKRANAPGSGRCGSLSVSTSR